MHGCGIFPWMWTKWRYLGREWSVRYIKHVYMTGECETHGLKEVLTAAKKIVKKK